ncbi:recombinase family protein [Clostridium botulinum]|nr:recombinase family protein [Clostridium botulinum D/C]QPW58638.1 recombinase family protein [Clostridium botulinum]MCD3239719.1 recombinase family protein [Clostridium botulinum D/C]MCD3267981.1 recombinase family protein [Clostridium botulinum D/C]MCD3314412.1 recombinase family protein [Clostridium botulinum D/C]
MMSKIKMFDVVACYKIDRIARNIVDFVNVYDELNKLGIKLISVTEGFDPSTPLGKLIMMILASFAEMERENIRQRVKDNMKGLAKAGRWTGGNVPFGFTSERIEEGGKKATYLKLDESKKQLIKEIFQMYISTNSMHKVQKQIYNTKNIKWSLSTIKNILTSPVYVKADKDVVKYLNNFGEVFGEHNGHNGIITYNRRPYTNGKHRWNDKGMFYSISRHEGVIDSTVWLKVQSIQEKTKVSPRPKNSRVSYLTGILKCTKCGSPMTISYNHKNKDGSITYVYLCTGRKAWGKEYCNCKQVKQTILDKEIENALNSYIELNIEEFKKVVGSPTDTENFNKKILCIEKKIETNKVKINNLVDKIAVLSNTASVPLLSKIEELTKLNEDLKKELLFIQQEHINSSFVSPEEKYERLKQFSTTLSTNNIDLKRELLNFSVQEIKWDSDAECIDIII